MSRFVLPMLLLATTATPLFAGNKEDVRVRTVKLELSPTPEPVPALKIELLPNLLDQTPGNAASLYYQAAILVAQVDEETLNKAIHWMEEVPPHELPHEEVHQALATFEATLHQVELAARRSRCDWELPIETEGFRLVLPGLQRLRTVARVLALKAKLEMAEGNNEEAIRTLQTGYSLARHLAEGPTLVHGLVGVAVIKILNYRLEEGLIQSTSSPNLYWAFTALPRPMVDLRQAMQTERFSLYFTFPMLQEVHSSVFRPEQEENLFAEVDAFLKFADESAGLPADAKAFSKEFVERAYPQARQKLIGDGHDPNRVEAMPKLQVVMLHSLEVYQKRRDDLFRWFHVPFWEARSRIEQISAQLAVKPYQTDVLPFAPLVLPSVGAAYRATTRLDQQIAMLRCVEAIRIYAAAHNRQLPGSLADITEVPIPLDPVSGEGFYYEVNTNQAVLEGASPGRTQDRYEITIRPMQADSPSGNE